MKYTAQRFSFSNRATLNKISRATRGQNLQGFTLVELLVVIAIIAILAAVVVLIINPLELTRRSRDAARFTDMASLQQAINVAAQEATNSGTDILCLGGLTGGACTGSSQSGTRVSDGTGWVKVNLSSQQSVSVPTLPVDPVNDTDYHYTYCSDGVSWEIDTVLESQQQINKMAQDGGDENDVPGGTAKYETGSKLDLIAASGGLCTY